MINNFLAMIKHEDLEKINFKLLWTYLSSEYRVSATHQAYLLTTLIAENGYSLIPKEESFRYSKKRFNLLFPNKVWTDNEIKLANNMYGGRYGNKSNEGWRYRGRGYIQLTFKANYQSVQEHINNRFNVGVDLVSNPNKLMSMEYALFSMFAFWHRELKGEKHLVGFTRKVTGSIRDFKRREGIFKRIVA